jgi:hypothetical protein
LAGDKIGAGAAYNIERGRLSAAIRTIVADAVSYREMVNDEVQKRQDFSDIDG